MQKSVKPKKKFKMPHNYVLIFSILIIIAVLTYIIPAGQYTRVENSNGRMVIDPESYTITESNPAKIFDIFKAFPKGLAASQNIAFFLFIVGGSFNIITKTGAIEAGINKIALKLRGNEKLMIPLIVIIFSLCGGSFGMTEETIAFIPIGIILARALGYDAMVGVGVISLGAAAGYTAGFMNPFNVGIAQGIAEVPMFSGIGLRLVMWVVFTLLMIIYISRYARKIKMNPEASIIYDLEQEEKDNIVDLDNIKSISIRDWAVLLVFIGGLIIMIFGVLKYEWYITEMAAIFFTMGIIAGFVSGMDVNNIAAEFINGAKDIASGALIVGLARGVLIIMENSLIIDTIVYSMAGLIMTLPKSVSAVGMMLVQSIFNFVVTSSSGMASITMPILTPVSDVIGVTRQTAVLAFQLGDGITNTFVPISGTLWACLSISKIKYEEWIKFIWPLMLIWTFMGVIFMIIATAIQYGPI